LQAAAIEGKPVLFLNNLTFDLDSSTLCQMVTDGTIEVRPFGKNDELIPCDCRGITVLANGNNIRVVGDLVRRTLTSRINAKMERPESRNFGFDPLDRVKANRGAYLAAFFTIVRAYMAAGSPKIEDAEPLAGFEAWSSMVRYPLMWLGLKDPVTSMEEARHLDPKRQERRERIGAYVKHMGVGVPFTAAALVKKALETQSSGFGGGPVFANQDLFNALSRDGRNINPKAVGNLLMDDRLRVCQVDGVDYQVALVREDRKSANTYRVEMVTKPDQVVEPEDERMT
jgi:putative DNA primase/helicase